MEFFFPKYSALVQQLATASLETAFTNIANQQGLAGVYATGRWDLCSSF